MREMRCLSLWQPWASLMAIGSKSIETRHWSTPYRGLVAIHAAKRWTIDEKDTECAEPFYTHLAAAGVFGRLPLGEIVAVGRLVECVHTGSMHDDPHHPLFRIVGTDEEEFGNYEPGRFGWVFRKIERLAEPIPYRGQQGLWTLEPVIVDQINGQVELSPSEISQ